MNYKNINPKELKRVLEETNYTIEQLLDECKGNDILTTILAGRISKKSSRQGNKDEELQIYVCQKICMYFNIKITKLKTNAIVPTKNGFIKTCEELQKNKIKLDNCLKSFDAKIEGKITGYIFSKIVYGYGGHQDTVFNEAHNLCEWIVKYHKNTKLYFVLLINTDLTDKFNRLKTKYKTNKNILVVNHYDFQKYIIKTLS